MNKTFKRFLTLLFLIIFLILYLLNSTIIPTSIIDYSIIFFKRLFPVSFIFFIFSSLLIDYGLIELLSSFFKLNSTKFYIFTMSLISGFPSGAKYIEELLSKEMITKEEANNYITFAHFPNPLFVLGTVASCTSKNIATKILLSIIISNFIISLIFNQKEKILINIPILLQ